MVGPVTLAIWALDPEWHDKVCSILLFYLEQEWYSGGCFSHIVTQMVYTDGLSVMLYSDDI